MKVEKVEVEDEVQVEETAAGTSTAVIPDSPSARYHEIMHLGEQAALIAMDSQEKYEELMEKFRVLIEEFHSEVSLSGSDFNDSCGTFNGNPDANKSRRRRMLDPSHPNKKTRRKSM